jgi:hypothetical protein
VKELVENTLKKQITSKIAVEEIMCCSVDKLRPLDDKSRIQIT